jgi:hypothetical protein
VLLYGLYQDASGMSFSLHDLAQTKTSESFYTAKLRKANGSVTSADIELRLAAERVNRRAVAAYVTAIGTPAVGGNAGAALLAAQAVDPSFAGDETHALAVYLAVNQGNNNNIANAQAAAVTVHAPFALNPRLNIAFNVRPELAGFGGHSRHINEIIPELFATVAAGGKYGKGSNQDIFAKLSSLIAASNAVHHDVNGNVSRLIAPASAGFLKGAIAVLFGQLHGYLNGKDELPEADIAYLKKELKTIQDFLENCKVDASDPYNPDGKKAATTAMQRDVCQYFKEEAARAEKELNKKKAVNKPPEITKTGLGITLGLGFIAPTIAVLQKIGLASLSTGPGSLAFGIPIFLYGAYLKGQADTKLGGMTWEESIADTAKKTLLPLVSFMIIGGCASGGIGAAYGATVALGATGVAFAEQAARALRKGKKEGYSSPDGLFSYPARLMQDVQKHSKEKKEKKELVAKRTKAADYFSDPETVGRPHAKEAEALTNSVVETLLTEGIVTEADVTPAFKNGIRETIITNIAKEDGKKNISRRLAKAIATKTTDMLDAAYLQAPYNTQFFDNAGANGVLPPRIQRLLKDAKLSPLAGSAPTTPQELAVIDAAHQAMTEGATEARIKEIALLAAGAGNGGTIPGQNIPARFQTPGNVTVIQTGNANATRDIVASLATSAVLAAKEKTEKEKQKPAEEAAKKAIELLLAENARVRNQPRPNDNPVDAGVNEQTVAQNVRAGLINSLKLTDAEAAIATLIAEAALEIQRQAPDTYANHKIAADAKIALIAGPQYLNLGGNNPYPAGGGAADRDRVTNQLLAAVQPGQPVDASNPAFLRIISDEIVRHNMKQNSRDLYQTQGVSAETALSRPSAYRRYTDAVATRGNGWAGQPLTPTDTDRIKAVIEKGITARMEPTMKGSGHQLKETMRRCLQTKEGRHDIASPAA